MTCGEIDELEAFVMKAYQEGNGSEIKRGKSQRTVSIVEDEEDEEVEDTRESLDFSQQNQ